MKKGKKRRERLEREEKKRRKRDKDFWEDILFEDFGTLWLSRAKPLKV